MTWKDALTDYQYFLKIERGLSENSIKAYSQDIQKLITFLTDQKLKESPDDIKSDIIEKFIYDSAKTVARDHKPE